jgi:hypothetical protein
MNALEKCHNRLTGLLGPSVESLKVFECADAHRVYWRPTRVRILLLAESHVYTTTSELDYQIDSHNLVDTNIPRAFVRLVYCLGYGENDLLNKPILDRRNSGTPQYWKIFYSCINRVCSNEDFVPILRRCTTFEERIWNKITLLRRLKEMGIWLVDASLAALYPKPSPSLIEPCLIASWEEYVSQVIRIARPSKIICIGKRVCRVLSSRISETGIPVFEIPQPNARLSSEEHLRNYQQYYDYCRV